MTTPTVLPSTPPPPPPRLNTLVIPEQSRSSWKKWVPAFVLLIAAGCGYFAWRSGVVPSKVFGQSQAVAWKTIAIDEGELGLVVVENGSLESASPRNGSLEEGSYRDGYGLGGYS